jgi:cellulose synthase (UDP-forming)
VATKDSSRRTVTSAKPRSSAQAAGLTTLIALSDEPHQSAEVLGTAPVLAPPAAADQDETASPGSTVTARPAAPGRAHGHRKPASHRADRRGYRCGDAKAEVGQPMFHARAADAAAHVPAARRQRVLTTAALSRRQRMQYAALAGLWLLASGYFWVWWVVPSHAGSLALFVVLSVALFYNSTLLPTFYLFYLGCMRRPVPMSARQAEETGVVGRVAVITLTVPGSESLDFVRRQLAAMKSIRYPHDCWVLVDKEHSPVIQQLARQMGIFYFSRHDEATWGAAKVAEWNQPGPPFQAKTKAGNVNSWLEQYGGRYTHFTQFDIDHQPAPSYLNRVLGFFMDAKVAWVQAPSVYGNHQYWTARGSSEQEVVLQGPLQMGFFGLCRTPFIIGSHCTYDMKAIASIGGFQPTRAEDHLDTVCLAARGYEGVYVPEVIATGDGPETFETYLAQQFAWAFSMIQILFRYTPRLIRRYTPRHALQFLFAQTWYPFWSLSMLAVFAAPMVSLVINRPISHVTLWDFMLHSVPAALTATAVWWWSRSWHQPSQVSLSWRGIALHMARWVIVVSAFAQVLLRVKKPYMITVKGVGGAERRIRLGPLGPYIGLILAPLAACWLYITRYGTGDCQGYLFFALEEAALFWGLLLLILTQEIRGLGHAGISAGRYLRLCIAPSLVTMLMTLLLVVTATASYSRILEALSKGVSWPHL